jgi:hypothetical protein
MKKLIQNPLKSNITFHFDNLMISNGGKNSSKMIILRHAQSLFNNEITKIEEKKNLMNESEFKKRLAEIRFSSEFLDS